jgi:hypothetical protein
MREQEESREILTPMPIPQPCPELLTARMWQRLHIQNPTSNSQPQPTPTLRINQPEGPGCAEDDGSDSDVEARKVEQDVG